MIVGASAVLAIVASLWALPAGDTSGNGRAAVSIQTRAASLSAEPTPSLPFPAVGATATPPLVPGAPTAIP